MSLTLELEVREKMRVRNYNLENFFCDLNLEMCLTRKDCKLSRKYKPNGLNVSILKYITFKVLASICFNFMKVATMEI